MADPKITPNAVFSPPAMTPPKAQPAAPPITPPLTALFVELQLIDPNDRAVNIAPITILWVVFIFVDI
jgi:hypothetical protein